MTREELARIMEDGMTHPSWDVRPSTHRVAGMVLAALEGHAVIDGQPVKLEEADAREVSGVRRGGERRVVTPWSPGPPEPTAEEMAPARGDTR